MFGLQLALAARYLWGRKLRSFLTTLAIVFGTLVIFAMNIILPTMVKAFQANLMAASGQVDVTVTLVTGEAFKRNVLNRVKVIAGIRTVAGSLSRTVNIPEGYYGKAKITALTLTGITPRSVQEMRSYPVQQGRFLHDDDTEVAVISTSLAEGLDLQVGDELHLPATDGNVKLTIVGLLPARALPGNEEVLVTLLEAQKLLDLPERINMIEINLETSDPDQRQAIQNAIQGTLGDDYVLGGLSSGTEVFASIQVGQAAFNLIGFLALFMGAFIIFNTFRTIVAERRRDIGMLRAIGASRRTIIGMILAEGFLQGAVGSLVGMGLGYLLGAVLLGMLAPMLYQYIHVQMGAPVISPGLVGTTLGLGVGMTLLAGLLPAISAGRVTPLEALRPSLMQAVQRTARVGVTIGVILIVLAVVGLVSRNTLYAGLGALAFLLGLVLVAPVLVRPVASIFSALIALAFARDGSGSLAQSNLTRQPTRAAVTASATMIGLAIIVALGGMVVSLSGNFLDMLRRSLGSDYLIMPPSVAVWRSNVGARSSLADRLHTIPGVGVVSTMRYASASADGQPLSLLGIDPLAFPQVSSLNFQQGEARSAFEQLANERALIANGVFAARLGLKVGDAVQLSTPSGLKVYRIAGVANDYINAKLLTAYLSQDNLLRDFRKSEDVFIQLNLAQGADAALVEARLQKILEDYPQFSLVSGRDYFEENKKVFESIFVFYFVLLCVLSFPSLIAMLNTLAIGVIERTREIGMLRAVGSTRRQVHRVVVIESLLLAAIGTAFGLLAGLYLGYVMVLGMSSGGFPVTYSLPYAGLLGAAAAGLLFGVLAALLPARQAANMEIVRALRYE